jgi:hypothetical protein
MKPFTATVGQIPCNLPVTNGTAIRYDWAVPASLDPFVARLTQAAGTGGATSAAPTGKVIGSPIQS